ncbi:hypothetical protein HMPREF1022_00295, partial [Desulfovibrio sp. 6_1_46AFAA]
RKFFTGNIAFEVTAKEVRKHNTARFANVTAFFTDNRLNAKFLHQAMNSLMVYDKPFTMQSCRYTTISVEGA